jgi:hypothetical protein
LFTKFEWLRFEKLGIDCCSIKGIEDEVGVEDVDCFNS